MGPALTPQKLISFTGVKGGVGCSILTALLGRILSKNHSLKIGILDAVPFPYSSLPSYLGLSNPKHCLTQLAPYQDQLNSGLLGNYFSQSPEGAFYMPLSGTEETRPALGQLLVLIEKITPWFDLILADLSGIPNDQLLPFLEKNQTGFFISSLDPASLKAARLWEKRRAAYHLPAGSFKWLFNQSDPGHPFPLDPDGWDLPVWGPTPFLGAHLALGLFEDGTLTPAVEKNLAPLAIQLKSLAAGSLTPTPYSPTGDGGSPDREEISLEMVHQLHQQLLEEFRKTGLFQDKKHLDKKARQELEPAAREILNRLMRDKGLTSRQSSQNLAEETINLAFGLGPLERLLRDEKVTEIMVNGPANVYVEKNGLLEKTAARFMDDQQLRTVIERILSPIGRRIDESQPYVDGRLSDGSRINAVIPPLSLTGPVLTIRKFSKRKLTIQDLLRLDSLTPEAADFLGACVKARKNIVVSGGTGSGKTTLLNILSHFIPPQERIVTIEDSAELQLSQEHVIPLECRPANLEGKGQVQIRDLVINALRMRPDRVVVGECRGGETLDMLQAMNTGHDGSLTTAHANSPRDALSRLETMTLFSGLELPLKAVREQIARAIHLIVQQSRLPGGNRAVTQITEIQGMEGDVIVAQDIFKREEGKELVRRSFPPAFIDDLRKTGYEWPGQAEKTKK